jgi:endonuclease/exonuclease/phosphatase (EEP) superfamily protein YafD
MRETRDRRVSTFDKTGITVTWLWLLKIYKPPKTKTILLTWIILLSLCPSTGITAGNNPLIVLTNNMGTIDGGLPKIEKLYAFLAKEGTPDIVLLQEVPSEKDALGIAAKLGLPFMAFSTYKPNGSDGVAILTRYPLSVPKILRQHGYASVSTTMDYMGTPILLCSVHLVRIKPLPVEDEKAVVSWSEFGRIIYSEVFQDNKRSRDVDNLLPWLEAEGVKTCIIGGDFNTFPFSKAVRKMTATYDDCFWPTQDYLTTSYPKVNFPLKPRIDHIFHSPDLKCVSAGVIKETAGDHYPVWATFDPQITQIGADSK